MDAPVTVYSTGGGIEALLTSMGMANRFRIAFPGTLRKSYRPRPINIDKSDAKFGDVLNGIFQQAREYRWSMAEDKLTVDSADELREILDVEIKDLSFQDELFCGLEEKTINLPAVVERLKKAGYEPTSYDYLNKPPGLCTCFYYGPRTEPDLVSMRYRSITLRELLNDILRKGYARSWAFAVSDGANPTISLKLRRDLSCNIDW